MRMNKIEHTKKHQRIVALRRAIYSMALNGTVENGYCDYHLVTKIGYCDYFALQFWVWAQ